MTGSERVRCVMEKKIPDRVPHFELTMDPKVRLSIQPDMDYLEFVEWADIDGVTALTMVEDEDTIQWVDKDKGLWRDKWGCLQYLTQDMLSVPQGPPRISCLEDLEGYLPPDPFRSPVIAQVKHLVEKCKGKRAICVVGEAVFAVSQYLRAGLEELMVDYILNPELAKRLAEIGRDYYIELYRKLIDIGAEIILLGDDYAGKTGTMMSKEHFDTYILPGLTDVTRAIKEKGGFVIKHTDGNVWGIIDSLVASGADMLGPLESPYMDLAEVRKYTNYQVGVVGNVDVDLLSRGTAEETAAETKRLLNHVSPRGGHILSSGNSICASVKGENYMAMVRTIQEFGRYPIYE